MTLIIGLKCDDGIVIGADGAATLGSAGTNTVRQEVKKLDIIDNKIIVGVSGPVGLGQKMKDTIQRQWENNEFRSMNATQVASKISEGMRQHIEPLLETAKLAAPVVGNGLAGSSVMSASIVAMIVNRKPELYQFDFQAASEQATNDIPFIAVGSGQHLADPFLAFIRRVFWKDRPPSIEEGKFAVLWTLQHAISLNTGGVSDPIQLMVLTEEGSCATELNIKDCDEDYQAIEAAEKRLSGFKDEITTEKVADIPPPPKDSK